MVAARNGCSKKWLQQEMVARATARPLLVHERRSRNPRPRNPRPRNLDIQLLHEKLPRELSWSESERELASAREISHESSFSLKKLKEKKEKTSSYYSKFQSLASRQRWTKSPLRWTKSRDTFELKSRNLSSINICIQKFSLLILGKSNL